MRKNFLIYQIIFIFSFFILSFSSCINQNFDLDDDKLDTNVTLGSGIDLPVGDIEQISIYDELLKVCDSLKAGDDGVLYVEYGGTFPVEFPEFKVPAIQNVEHESPMGLLNGNILLPEELLLAEAEIADMMTKPELKDDNLHIDPIEIGFSSLTLKVGFELSGLDLDVEDNNAVITVTLTFPKNYELEEELTINREVYREVPFKDINKNGYTFLEGIKVKSYTFGDKENLTYTVVLKKGDAASLDVTDPTFKFVLEAESPNPPEISYLKCHLSGTKSFSGEVTDFGDLQSAFGEGDTLEFKNSSLSFDLRTNFISADFKLGFNMSSDRTSASLGDNLLIFNKPENGDTSYVLTKTELENFDRIISTPFPKKLDYSVELIFDNPDQEVILPGSLDLSANYSFKIPFEFDKISLSLKNTITDLFNEDTYEQIFSHVDDVSIVADLDISIESGRIELDDAVILDSDSKEIPDLVTASKDGNLLSIAIKNNEEEKMKKARHLELTFRLSGGGAIKESDYIKINKLRLVSSSGIHYEF